jgi:hypothetical protein
MDHENFDHRQKRIVLNQVTFDVMAMTKIYYLVPRGAVQFGTQLDLSEEDATSIFFDPKMDVEFPPETSVLIKEITEQDIAKTVTLIEPKAGIRYKMYVLYTPHLKAVKDTPIYNSVCSVKEDVSFAWLSGS